MNKEYISKLNMAHTCLAVIHAPEHVMVLNGASRSWHKAVADAQGLTDAIMEAGQAQDSAKVPSTAGKHDALDQLGDCALALAGSLHALAVDRQLHDLAVATHLSRYQITRGSDSNVVNRCLDIHRLAAENLELLKEDNITAEDVAALKACIETFEGLQTKPRKTRATGKAASQHLDLLFEELMEVFNERLDKLALKFKQTAPEFYRAYRAARVIVDPAKPKATEPATAQPVASKPAS